MRTPEEQTLIKDFDSQYERLNSPLWQNIERNVCGCDYGGTSWTTREEADWICDLLQLAPGRRLLEIGAGSGWPGLYMAHETSCDVALVDLPLKALRIAAQRAHRDKLTECFWIALADAVALPFKDHAFDCLSHSDVLCCLDAKLDVLKECWRVIRSDGTMVFTVISITPGLSAQDQTHAIEFGPPFVDADSDYDTMLSSSGWRVCDYVDLTNAYLLTSRRYLKELEANGDELKHLLGAEEFGTTLTRLRTKVDAIDKGLFRRELFVTAPVGIA